MKKNTLSICIAFLLSVQFVNAQQYPLFTNYVINCLGFNPAVASLEQGLDAKLTYRTQWTGISEAPKTSLFSLTYRPEKIKIGFGGYFFNDGYGALKRTGGAGVLSYTQNLSAETSISLGASIGYYQTSLSNTIRATDPNDPTFSTAQGGVSEIALLRWLDQRTGRSGSRHLHLDCGQRLGVRSLLAPP